MLTFAPFLSLLPLLPGGDLTSAPTGDVPDPAAATEDDPAHGFGVVLAGLGAPVALDPFGLGFDAVGLSWVQNAYMLFFGGFLLLAARAGDASRWNSR